MWVVDTGATCNVGPSLEGCSDIQYLNEKTMIGNGHSLQIKAKATFHGVVKGKDGKSTKVKMQNYAYVPNVEEFLFSVTHAKKMGMKFFDEGETISLRKGSYKLLFDLIFPKGSSFQMCISILPSDEVTNITKEGSPANQTKKKEEKTQVLDEETYHENSCHPSTELTLSTARSS